MTRTDHLEREFKLAADLSFALPDLRPIVGDTTRLPAQTLNTTYIDTPDHRLWGRGITLRHRDGEEGDGGLWTMKLPEEATDSTLKRTELSWPGSRREVPAEARQLLRGVVRRAGLREVVELESIRQRLLLGPSFGEIDDDTVTVKSGTRKDNTFRQIELELGTDSAAGDPNPAMIDAVLNELRLAGARPDGEQKFTMALDLGEETDVGPVADNRATIGTAVALSIRNGLNRLLDHDVRLRLDPLNSPKRSVHQARVATRRLRSDLKTFRKLLDPVWLEHTTTELKWLGATFGQVRDLDVLSERLDESVSHGLTDEDDLIELRSVLVRQRFQAGRELGEALDGDRYMALLERLSVAGTRPPLARPEQGTTRASELLPALVRSQYKALRRRVKHGGRHPDDGQLHRIRIGAKQLRYAAEAAGPFMGMPSHRTGRRAEKLQTVLGEHHDAVTAEVWMRQAAADDGSLRAAFTAGQLVAEARRQRVKRARHWRKVWRHVGSSVRWTKG